MFRFSSGSEKELVGVSPRLVLVVRRALVLTPVDFRVLQGLRSAEQARINFGKGRTVDECVMAGIAAKYAKPSLAKVTWVRNPYSSKHMVQADGFGHAVDLLPAPYDWKDTKPFDLVAEAMATASAELSIKTRWGYDWDGDGIKREKGENDGAHHELVG